MSLEIERKFLVTGDFKQYVSSVTYIKQGYLSSVPERSVRIRIRGSEAFITIKGLGDTSGKARYEWEKEIELEEGKQLLDLCEPGIIEKNRHIILSKSHKIEVDEFLGDNAGLIIAEIELESEDDEINVPEWFGIEITGIEKYYNAMLIKRPYNTWQK